MLENSGRASAFRGKHPKLLREILKLPKLGHPGPNDQKLRFAGQGGYACSIRYGSVSLQGHTTVLNEQTKKGSLIDISELVTQSISNKKSHSGPYWLPRSSLYDSSI